MELSAWTLALQAVNFLVLVWLLRHFLYRPVQAVIAARKQRTEQALEDARRREREAEDLKAQLAAARAELERDRADYRRALEEKLEAERKRTLEAAEAEARRIVDEGRSALATERQRALDELEEDIAGLAADMAASLLRALGATASPATTFEALLAHLEARPEPERRQWCGEAGEGALRLTLTTAAPVPAERRDDWRERLAACLGCKVEARFEVDPDLLGGIELRLPQHRIDLGWAEQLAEAKRDLLRHDHAA
jgi:F-type H+-transporting ATPase subunit b